VRVVIGEVLPLALVVTLSPLNIIPSILLLFSRRPLRTASAFLAGFLLGVGAVLTALALVAGAIDVSSSSDGSTVVSLIKVVLGGSLLVAAARKFVGRPRDDAPAGLPSWMTGLTESSPSRAAATGAVLGAGNPKNLVVGAAAAMSISAAGLSVAQDAAAVALYVVVAGAGVAAPIVAMLVLRDRSDAVLDRWKRWLERNNPLVMATLFVVFGVVLVAQGILGS
jgi:hypothetical protein